MSYLEAIKGTRQITELQSQNRSYNYEVWLYEKGINYEAYQYDAYYHQQTAFAFYFSQLSDPLGSLLAYRLVIRQSNTLLLGNST